MLFLKPEYCFLSYFKAEQLNFRINSFKNTYEMKIYREMSDIYLLMADPLGGRMDSRSDAARRTTIVSLSRRCQLQDHEHELLICRQAEFVKACFVP